MASSGGPMAWVVWGVGLLGYAITIMHRSVLGVAGLIAAEHFGTTPGIVSTFVVLQLATYALAQVPVGILLDRFGSRVMLTAGLVVVASGQALLATADDLSMAYAARVLFGVGDAFMFNSVLRLIPRWFKPNQAPVLSQATGVIGMLGQVAAVWIALPLIQGAGWQTGILLTVAASLAVAVGVALVVRNAPEGAEASVVNDSLREIPSQIRGVTGHPATQLGFWVHFTSGFSINTFTFMWGIPYLVVAQGLSQAAAGSLFTLLSISAMVAGPVIGALTARHPLRRSNLVLILVGTVMVCWAAVLLWPGQAPFPLLVGLVVALAASGPGTAVGFDFPRTNLPVTRLGAANGVVIAGGFVGGTSLILLMGVFLDWIAGGGDYTPLDMRLAWLLQIPFFVVGIAGILISRRKLRRVMEQEGIVVPSWREVVQRIRRRRAQR